MYNVVGQEEKLDESLSKKEEKIPAKEQVFEEIEVEEFYVKYKNL